MSLIKIAALGAFAAIALVGCEKKEAEAPQEDAKIVVQTFAQDLPPESTFSVETLPAQYPKDWVFSQDLNFVEPVGGKVVVIDVASTSHNFKGVLSSAQFGSFTQSRTRPELYSAQTFYSRGTYGDRTDMITIYDTATLLPTAEILLPGGKRAQVMTARSNFIMSGNDRFSYVFNFTPDATVDVVDMIDHKIVDSIRTPGCSQLYPTGATNFAMQCSNGSMSIFEIDAAGKFTNRTETAVFNDLDNNPLFIKYALVDDVAYFPTFLGDMQAIALKNGTAEVLDRWSLVTDAERAKNWRPGGWQIVAGGDVDGHIYVLMHENGFEGSHKNGGSQVWVFDVATKKKIRTITMPNWGVTIAVTRGETPYLVATNGNMEMDVFDARTGVYLRTIGGGATQHAFQIQPVQ